MRSCRTKQLAHSSFSNTKNQVTEAGMSRGGGLEQPHLQIRPVQIILRHTEVAFRDLIAAMVINFRNDYESLFLL